MLSASNTDAARLRAVDDHIRFECEHDLDALMRTFGADPEWCNQAGQEVLHGHDAIRGFYQDLFAGFRDFHLDVHNRHQAADAVIVEGLLGGTHSGEWMGIPPTGRSISVPFCAVFTFTAEDHVKRESVYYDRMALLGQLGVLAAPGGATA
jgi:steroid delta-isomerase-like uncharacterized protein